MFKTIYKHLKSKGIDCYSIGQHKGLCEKEYVVIKNNTPRSTSKVMLEEEVELLLYHKIGEYTKMIDFVEVVKEAMRGLSYEDNCVPFPIIIEDEKQAYMTILSYTNTRKRVF